MEPNSTNEPTLEALCRATPPVTTNPADLVDELMLDIEELEKKLNELRWTARRWAERLAQAGIQRTQGEVTQ